MKSFKAPLLLFCLVVTPFVGVWIEIFIIRLLHVESSVTPFAGVWIEIYVSLQHSMKS